MRALLLIGLVLLVAACTESSASRIDERTFRIEGPPVPGGAEGPNRRLAERVCPRGYRIMDQESHRGGPDRATYEAGDSGTTTIWTIRCL